MFGLFSKHKSKKPRAVAFVDYEHWYISLEKLHGQKPDIKGWYKDIASRYDIKDIIFFADFSNTAIRLEIPKIREVSSTVVETQNTSAHFKKDFTDFIMLDHIYQKAIKSNDIDTFIIFTGDGHFSSVASFLVTRCEKEVGIYGVRDAISLQLQNSASWTVEVPIRDSALYDCYGAILKNISNINSKTGKKKMRPTFWGTVDAVARQNGVEREYAAKAMRDLIDKGYVYQKSVRINPIKTIKVLDVKLDQAKKDGLWKE